MKRLIALSAVAAIATASFGAEDVESRLSAMEAKVHKLEKDLKKAKKTASAAKKMANNDNIKWNVDLRTAMDSIHYTHASGKKSSNPDLLTNRLWLGMGFAPDENNLFRGILSYNKAYGDSANHSQANTQPGYANFDWVTNENATDNTLKVKEAFWLYKQDTLFGSDVSWTASLGRRPSTDGLGINMREGMKAKSPLSHTVNVEFDGGSARFNLDKVTGVEGMWFKLCTGRGITNAKPRFSMPNGDDYAADSTQQHDNNMYGFIFVPWDNGQYSVHTNWAKAEHMIGFDKISTYALMGFNNTELGYMMDQQTGQAMGTTTASDLTNYGMNTAQADSAFKDVGDLELFTMMFKAEGIGSEINDFLDDTRFFASWAQSKTDPANGMSMLGSTESQTGNSTWLGINMPCPLTEDGRIGVEWNKGSKYWRSVTYGEDTMAGSKIATRGTAWEVYYNKPLTKALNFNARYTKIDYDYTGSNGFFGAEGTPMSWSEVAQYTMAGMDADPVKEASDLRVSISYRF